MNLQAIAAADGFGITLMLMLLISAGKNIRRSDRSEKIFYAMIWATAALCGMEMASFLIDGRQFPLALPLNWLLNALLFSTNAVFVYLWTLYIDFRLFGKTERLRRRHLRLAIPMLGVLGLVAASFFRPLIFTVSPGNVYARGPLAAVPFLVSFFYLGWAETAIYTTRSNDRRYLFIPSVLFILPILAGSILQLLFYGLSLLWPALSVSMVSVYINIQCEFSSVDPLSGVYTRQYLDEFLRRLDGRRACGGVMIDLDRFKRINDTFGHQAGDDAIRDFGHLLRSSADSRDVIARYGGDEFVLLRPDAGTEELQSFAASFARRVEAFNASRSRPYALGCSLGTGAYVPGRTTVDEFLRSMDASMYESKKMRSGGLPDRRGRSPAAEPSDPGQPAPGES